MTPWRKYKTHSYRAKRSGIEFLLTFDEWMKIWEDSGHFHERGCHRGQYVMARFGDKGPYAVGNVKIIKHEENGSEKVFVMGEEQKVHLRQIAIGRTFTAETRAKISRKATGRKHSIEVRKKMSQNMLNSKRSNNVLVDYLGNLMPLRQAIYAAGNVVNEDTARHRLRNGWPHREAVEIPLGTKRHQWPSLQLG